MKSSNDSLDWTLRISKWNSKNKFVKKMFSLLSTCINYNYNLENDVVTSILLLSNTRLKNIYKYINICILYMYVHMYMLYIYKRVFSTFLVIEEKNSWTCWLAYLNFKRKIYSCKISTNLEEKYFLVRSLTSMYILCMENYAKGISVKRCRQRWLLNLLKSNFYFYCLYINTKEKFR